MTNNLIAPMNKKTRSTESGKGLHTWVSVQIARMSEQKLIVTSYVRNKNLDEIRKPRVGQ